MQPCLIRPPPNPNPFIANRASLNDEITNTKQSKPVAGLDKAGAPFS